MTRPTRRLLGAALAAAAVVPMAACGSDGLSERDPRTVRVGQVLATSFTAAIRGTQSHVTLPSGRVDLTLGRPVDEVAAQDAAKSSRLRPADGAQAVGVTWALNRGATPDTPNRQLTGPTTIVGLPQPVRLWLVTDGTRREIRDVGTMEQPGVRPRTAAWVIVPAGVRSWRFEVSYAGAVQSVDARTGTVRLGLAAALYRPLPLDREASCQLGIESLTFCLIDYAVGYPYVDKAGWAPAGKVWALVRVRNDEFPDPTDVRVAGARASARLSDSTSEMYGAHLVTPARTYALRATGKAETYDGNRTVSTTLTATLTNGGTA